MRATKNGSMKQRDLTICLILLHSNPVLPMMQFVPQESPQPRPAVLEFLRQFARQFRPVAPAGI